MSLVSGREDGGDEHKANGEWRRAAAATSARAQPEQRPAFTAAGAKTVLLYRELLEQAALSTIMYQIKLAKKIKIK